MAYSICHETCMKPWLKYANEGFDGVLIQNHIVEVWTICMWVNIMSLVVDNVAQSMFLGMGGKQTLTMGLSLFGIHSSLMWVVFIVWVSRIITASRNKLTPHLEGMFSAWFCSVILWFASGGGFSILLIVNYFIL